VTAPSSDPRLRVPAGGDPRGEEGDEPRVVIRDKRRFDPVTGQPREVSPQPGQAHAVATGAGATPAGVGVPGDASVDGAAAELARTLEERTADLQRVTAEYANYRRRVERDRLVAAEQATAALLAALLPVLDDIERARQHGDLTGAFRAVADTLQASLSRLGLVALGAPGEAFDPALHEAVTSTPADPDAPSEQPTVSGVMRPGYRLGERLLRPAMVAVSTPG